VGAVEGSHDTEELLVASVADPKVFRSGRNFSAWIGLVPKQHSSGVGPGSAVSANRGTAICAACSWPAHSPLHPHAPN
jgi:transposase